MYSVQSLCARCLQTEVAVRTGFSCYFDPDTRYIVQAFLICLSHCDPAQLEFDPIDQLLTIRVSLSLRAPVHAAQTQL